MHQTKAWWAWAALFCLFVGCSGDSPSSDPPSVRSVGNEVTAAPPAEASDDQRVLGLEEAESIDWTEATGWTSERGALSQSKVFVEGATALELELPRKRTAVCSNQLSVPWKRSDTIEFQLWMQESTEFGEVRVVLHPAAPGASPIELAPVALSDKQAGVFHPIVSSVESEGLVIGEDAPIQVCIVIDAEAGRYVVDDLRFTYPPSDYEGSSDATAGIGGNSISRSAGPLSLGDAEWPNLTSTTGDTVTADRFLAGPTTAETSTSPSRDTTVEKVSSPETKSGNTGDPSAALFALDDPDFCTTETLLPTAPFVSSVSPPPDGVTIPYPLCTAEQYAHVVATDSLWSSNFVLMADIDFSTLPSPPSTASFDFGGVFDGNNKTLSNYTTTSTVAAGLLGKLMPTGVIRNLVLRDFSVSGVNRVGALVHENLGLIEHVAATNLAVSGSTGIGVNLGIAGIAGGNYGTLLDVTASVNVTGVSDAYSIGGLVGRQGRTSLGLVGFMTDCSVSGSVTRLAAPPTEANLLTSGGAVGLLDEGNIVNTHSSVTLVSSGGLAGGLVGHSSGLILASSAVGPVTAQKPAVGGLVGRNAGTIQASFSTGSVSSDAYVGGLVGLTDGNSNISDSYATGNVQGTVSGVGGLCGRAMGVIATSYATGNVQGAEMVGGLVGYLRDMTSSVSQSWASGNVSASGRKAGGLVGVLEGHVDASYARGDVRGTTQVGGLAGFVAENGTLQDCAATANAVVGTGNVGGLVGNLEGHAERCFATANVTGDTRVGGLIGEQTGDVFDSYATGSVTASGVDVGGFVGRARLTATVVRAYSAGAVTGPAPVGGFAGEMLDTSSLEDCHFNASENPGLNAVGNNASAAGVAANSASVLRQEDTFTDWDFEDVWGILEDHSFPFLEPVPACTDGGCSLGCPCPPDTCASDSGCAFGQVCGEDNGGYYDEDPDADVCWDPLCGTDQREQLCAAEGTPCGECVSDCLSDADCPSGQVCGEDNGAAVGAEPGTNACWDPVCETEDRINNCGSVTSLCGYCDNPSCNSGSDCAARFSCGYNNGGYFGLPSDVDVCWPTVCETAREINCGPDSACGTCTSSNSGLCEPDCAGATCGSLTRDGCGGFCRACAAGESGCEGDAECQEGYVCGDKNGELFGFAGASVCWRANCVLPGAECGEDTECGECPPCEPSCNENAPCGDDGCGESCGECAEGLECRSGSCVSTTVVSQTLPEGVDPTDYETEDYSELKLGSMLGDERIALDGQVAYTMPLRLPPGQNGLVPKLALEYHGSRGNGLVGAGWALQGFSEITRCERTVSHDGGTAPLSFTDDDRFCVDGRRLENISGDYGADGSVYRSEFDDVTKYVFERPVQSAWFRAYGKDGLIRTYGQGDETVLQPLSEAPTRWLLNEVEDRYGNRIKYDSFGLVRTSSDWDERRIPASIDYGGDFGSFPYSTSVEFSYEQRPDKRVQYDRYVSNIKDVRLKTIIVQQFQRRVREYRLHYYELGEDRPSLLRAVEECVLRTPDASEAEDLVCSQPMTFEYERDELLFEEFAAPVQLGLHPVDAIYLEDPNRYAWTPSEHILDFDGDGIDDIAMQVFNDETGWEGRDWHFLRGGREAIETPFDAPGRAYLYGHLSTVLDIDADGRDELLMEGLQDRDATYTYVDYENGAFQVVDTEIPATNYEFLDSFTYIVDVDGDGLKDIVRCDERDNENERTWRVVRTPTLSVSSINLETVGCFRQYAAVDVNMDGREELITTGQVRDESGEFVDYGLVAINFDGFGDDDPQHGTGTQTVLRINFNSDLSTNYIAFKDWDDQYLVTLDATGDGLADIVVFDGQHVITYVNTGARTDGTPLFEYETRLNGEYGAARLPSGAGFKFGPVLDVNADGRQDIMVYSNSTEDPNWFALVATNGDLWDPVAFTGYSIVELSGIPAYGPSNRPIAMDFDGDGVRDYVQKDTAGLGADYFMGYRKVGKPHPKLTRVEDSYGNVVEFTYKSLSNPEVYASVDSRDEGSCNYPVLCRTPRGTVVHTQRRVETSGSSREFVHSYAGARYGLRGRSFLGFAIHEVLEADREALTTTLFANSVQSRSGAYPYVGLPQEITAQVYEDGRAFERRIINTFALHYHEDRENDVFFPYIDSTTSVRRELVSGRGLVDVNIEQTDYSVDEYNNIKQVDTSWDQTPGAGAERQLTTFSYEHEEDDSFVDSWLVALPREQVDTSSGQPGSDTAESESRTVEYRHFEDGGVRQVTIAPDNAELRSETHFTYDEFGNAEQVTEIAEAEGEEVTRTTTLEHDERGVFPRFVTDAEGYLTEFEFDPIQGQPAHVVFRGSGAEFVEQFMVSDGFGRPRYSRAPSGVEKRTSYAPLEAGGFRVTQSVDGRGVVVVDYDGSGRVIQSRATGFEGEQLAQSTLYDASGSVSEVTRPMVAGGTTQRFVYSYDHLGRRTSVEHPDESVTEICHDGRVMCVRNVNGNTRCSKRDVRGRIVLVTEPVHVSAGECQERAVLVATSDDMPGMTYQYGPFDTVERIWDPAGNLTRITYDELGQVRTRRDPGTELNTELFNGFGELEVVQRGDPDDGIESTSSYDLLGRPTQVVTADGTTRWEWDPDRPGIISSATSPSGVVREFDYNDQLQLNGHSLRVDEDEEADDVIYQVAERDEHRRPHIVTIQSRGGGALNLRYDYDVASGALSAVRDDDSGATYWRLVETDDFGAVEVERTGGWTTELSHEPDTGLISGIRTTSDDDDTVLQDLGFDFDASGNLREKVNNQADESTSYSYDEHDRLDTAVSIIGGLFFSEQYDYDDVGNLRQLPGVNSLEYEHEGKPHAVSRATTADGQVDYTYDDFGRLETRRGESAPDISVDAYTAFDLPAAITLEEELTREFKYDAAQNRVVSEDANSRTILGPSFYRTEAPDGSDQVHNFIITNGERAVAQLIRRETAGGFEDRVVYLHRDHLGSIVAATEGDEVIDERSYANFGAVTQHEEDPDGTLLSFAGHLEDLGGLVDMGGRIYDPLVGRFTTPDPVIADPTNSQDYNRYGYVRNNPTSLTDPTGLCACDNLSPGCWCYTGGIGSVGITPYQDSGIAAPGSAANADQTWNDLSVFSDGALSSGRISVYLVAIPYEVIDFTAASYSDSAIHQERWGPGLAYSKCVWMGASCPGLGDTLLASQRLDTFDYFQRLGAELVMGDFVTLLDPTASNVDKSIAVVMIVAGIATGGAVKILQVARVARVAKKGHDLFTVRRFVSRLELKQLRKEGVLFDVGKGSGIPTTTRNFTPATQDIARLKTGARDAEYWVDLDVTGIPRGPTTNTRWGLPEYPIQGDLLPNMIIEYGKVPK